MRIAIAIFVVCLFYLTGTAFSKPAALTLAAKGRGEYVIVVGENAPANEQHAARELAHFLGKVTGAKFPIRTVGKGGTGAKIAVGPAAALKLAPDINLKGLGNDGIVIQTRPPHLILTGAPGAPRGTLYAVYTFLEDVVGCRWWTSKVSKIPRRPILKIPSLNIRYVPILEYRSPYYFDAFDADWSVRNKVNGDSHKLDKKRGGKIRYKGFVHTFQHLVPPEKHFKEHPEWFAEINGKRVAQRSQLCLTNKQLQAFVIRRVKQWLSEAPDAHIVSVSQNDNQNRCQCPRCLAVERAEGNCPSGPLLRFVNAVAEAVEKDHPNVAISTLAYQYTRKPPRITKPRRNVIVRLCSIECSFAQPLTHVKNRSFHDDIVGWSKICNRLYVWDYVTNFTNYLQPHPNLRVLGPNLRFFVKHGGKGIFEQGNSRFGCGEMAELRAWVLAKLLWNPKADEKKLIKEFLAGYYEDAAPFMEKYINLVHDEVERTEFYMRCYVAICAPFLTPGVILRAEKIFQDAERAVAGKDEVLERVRLAHLPVQYVVITCWSDMVQAARKANQPWPFPATPADAVAEFCRTCDRHKITSLSEGGKTPEWLRLNFSQAVTTTGAKGKTMKTVADMAQKTKRPKGAPEYSDVCFSSRWKRPVNDKDPHDTFLAAAAFHATRLDWVYSWDKKWISKCKKMGYTFGGALNSKLPDGPGLKTRKKGRIKNQKGEFVTAPWMKGWEAWWGCANSPEYRRSFLEHAKVLIDGGADSLHVDDACMNHAAVRWGGCYCKYCRAKAKKLGKSVKEIQKQSVGEFFSYIRKEIDKYAGRHVPISTNNWGGNWKVYPYSLFDFGIAELELPGKQSLHPAKILARVAEARKLGKAQVFTFSSTDVRHTRKVIATAYACGSHLVVPWDIFLGGEKKRYFGKPEEYADLYGFVRANAALLDGYEDAAAAGKGISDSRYRVSPPVSFRFKGGSGEVRAFVRAVPGSKDKPVVVHLVEWSEKPEPFTLTLSNNRFFKDKVLAIELLVPAAHDGALHKAAEKSKNFTSLLRKPGVSWLTIGGFTDIRIPALSPWGILVIRAN